MEFVSLKDKVAVVTGGGSGLGAAICRRLSDDGAIVVACDTQADAAESLAEELRGLGRRAYVFRLDVGDEPQVRTVAQAILDQFDRVDVLVNNAGTDVTKPFEQMDIDEWNRVIDVNLRGAFLLTRLLYPWMRHEGYGHIVNIVSTAAKRAWTEASAYHASKWGLLGLSHALHAEGRRHGVRVTAVVSGGMRTPFILDRFPDIDPSTLQDPANVAEVVHFALTLPAESVMPEVMVVPMKETSWP